MKVKLNLRKRISNKEAISEKKALSSKSLKEKMLGSASELKKRIEIVYGNADCMETVQKYQNRNQKRYMLLLVGTLVVMGILAAGLLFSANGIITGEGGSVVALERPDKGDATKYMLVVNEASSGKRLVTGNITILPEGEMKVGTEKTGGLDGVASQRKFEEEQLAGAKTRAAKHILSDMAVSTQGAVLVLPEELPDGTKIKFETKNSTGNFIMALAAIAILCVFIYCRRYTEADREIAAAKASVICELPDFINKLVLLLAAGLIVTSAFDKILERPKENSYFYQQLLVIQSNIKQTNSSFEREFGGFSRRIGVRELMRASNIIADNLDKGSELSEKLMAEANLLWHERKKAVEENGRIAETKLTFPLMILLVVLIMITIAPALMEI